MAAKEPIILKRNCDATIVPTAQPINLEAGTEVVIKQSYGGTFTVYVGPHLARIEGYDADALGLTMDDPLTIAMQGLANCGANASLTDKVWAVLKTCYDPEIPVSIVDLGIVYTVELYDQTKIGDSGYAAEIRMTLTAPGCSMGPILINDIKERVALIEDITVVDVELVFDPMWNQDMMSEPAKLALGLL